MQITGSHKVSSDKAMVEGVQRDMISANNGLSAGAVTNIVNDFRRGLGSDVVDVLRKPTYRYWFLDKASYT
jgi:hypothetical protein